MLRIRLLGEFDVRHGRERVPVLRSPRLQSLLAYLVLHRDAPQSRRHIAFVMWPESSESQAHTNLRQLLHHLRRELPDAEHVLALSREAVHLRPDTDVWTDVAAFEDAADQAIGPGADTAALVEAAGLYGGELLPGCYDDWIVEERARLLRRQMDILDRLVRRFESERDYRSGVRFAQELLRWDPVDEGTYRRLMRFHALLGERARALRTYHLCATALERELGVEPDAATRAVYESLIGPRKPPLHEPAVTGPKATAGFVGRRPERERAIAAWREAASGHPLMLAVTGEAGIGKSRFVDELAVSCDRQGAATAWSRAYAAEGRLAYAPVAEWLRSPSLRTTLSGLDDVWLSELARLLPELGPLRPPGTEPLTEGERRRRLFEALARAVLATGRPLLLVLDDAQWCDEETLEFLHFLLRFDPGARLLVAATVREGEVGPGHPLTAVLAGLRSVDRLCEIPLGPLGVQDTALLAEQVHDSPIAADAAQRLYRETEGNPLFVVESVRTWGVPARTIDRVAPSSGGSVLAPKIRSVVESRLAQLSPGARDLATLAATIGREFTHGVLVRCGGLGEDELVRGLDELWQRRIIREQAGGTYDFSHDKIREVAYGSVGPARRRRLHLEVAEALAATHHDDLASVAGQIAVHYDRAGIAEQAIRFYRQAAEAAHRLWASEDVITALRRALELQRALPETPQRDEDELGMLIGLSVALVARRGHGSRQAVEVYRRARTLCDRLGRPLDPPVLRGLALAALVRRAFDEAIELGSTLLRHGQEDDDQVLVVEGHYVLGVSTFWRGELEASREHLQTAIERYRPADHRVHVALYAQDPKAVCLSRLALTLAYLGRPVTAIAVCDEALALARRLEHPFTLGYVLLFATWLHGEIRDIDRMASFRAEAADVNAGQEMAGEFDTMIRVFEGWTEAVQGRAQAGVELICEGLEGCRRHERLTMETYGLALLARAQILAGTREAAYQTINEALMLTEQSGQHYLQPELLRLSGELLVDRDAGQAEMALRRAVDVARSHRANLLELRAATSLARLIAGRPDGRVGEHLLQEVYARFDEGQDLPDLREARTVLDEWERPSERS